MKTQKGTSIPIELARELKKNRQALSAFQAMPPSHQKEYVGYIAEAKKAETRTIRAAKSIEMILRWQLERKVKKTLK